MPYFQGMELPLKQRLFVREYVKDRNATRAYIAAGYGKNGAAQSASALLRNPKVKNAVDKALARLEVKLELSAERNLQRIAEIAYHRPTAKTSDVLKACELLGKHFNQFTDSLQVTGKNGGPQVILHLPANESEAESVKPESEVPNASG